MTNTDWPCSVLVASIIRMPTLQDLFTTDFTCMAPLRTGQSSISCPRGADLSRVGTTYAPSLWSATEANLGIVCACLPLMRPLLRLTPFHVSSYGGNRSTSRASAMRMGGPSLGSRVRSGAQWTSSVNGHSAHEYSTNVSQTRDESVHRLWTRNSTIIELQEPVPHETKIQVETKIEVNETERETDNDLEEGLSLQGHSVTFAAGETKS